MHLWLTRACHIRQVSLAMALEEAGAHVIQTEVRHFLCDAFERDRRRPAPHVSHLRARRRERPVPA